MIVKTATFHGSRIFAVLEVPWIWTSSAAMWQFSLVGVRRDHTPAGMARARSRRKFDKCPGTTFRRMAPPELWVARHGETEWTLSRRHTGRTDLPLTEEGARVAREVLAPKLAGAEFDLVLSSPLRRALHTARLAGFAPEVDERLREMDYGDYEGLTTVEIRERRPDWDLWRDGCPNGETAEDVAARMDALIAERLSGGGPRILAFGHGHALRILVARWLALPPAEGRVLLLAPAAVGVTGAEHGRPALARWGP